MKRSRRGVGSNQYVDKAQLNPAEEAEHNARVRASKSLATVTHLGPQQPHRADRTSELATGLTSVMDEYTRLLGAGNFTAADVEGTARRISLYEDEIRTTHPNVYGLAVVEAVHELNNFKLDRRANERARTAGTPEHAIRRASRAIISDAMGVGKQLDLEELAVNLDTLSSASGAREQGKATWHEKQGAATLSSRYAAASVLSSRDPEDDSLRSELGELRNSLIERGLLKINL